MVEQRINLSVSCQDCLYTVNSQQPINQSQKWELVHDTKSTTVIELRLLQVLAPGGHIKIDCFEFAGQQIHHWDRFGVYRTAMGQVKKTYGWMDEPGTYRFKIRYSQNLHCFLMYLLDIGQ
jgi:hypothetical protein